MPKFLSQINASQIPIKGLVVDEGSTFPSSPVNGQLFRLTTDGLIYRREGGAWKIFVSTKADIGLGNVDNTSDLNKPISTATQTALNGKSDVGHTHGLSDLDPGAGTGVLYADSGSVTNQPAYSIVQQGFTELNGSSLNVSGVNITNVQTPTFAPDAANKGYVDSVVQGLAPKESVRVASTANVSVLSGLLTIDGVTLVAGNRVLLKNQTTGSQNGIYVAASGSWTRSSDADTASDLSSAFVFVEEGTTLANTAWLQTADNITVGTTALTWVQFTSAGDIIAGSGLTKTGNTISIANNSVSNVMIADNAVNLSGSKVTGTLQINKGGTGSTNTTAARIALGTPGNTYIQLPALTAGTWTNTGITVNMASAFTGYNVRICDSSTDETVYLDVRVNSGNLQVRSDVAVAVSTLSIMYMGWEG